MDQGRLRWAKSKEEGLEMVFFCLGATATYKKSEKEGPETLIRIDVCHKSEDIKFAL